MVCCRKLSGKWILWLKFLNPSPSEIPMISCWFNYIFLWFFYDFMKMNFKCSHAGSVRHRHTPHGQASSRFFTYVHWTVTDTNSHCFFHCLHFPSVSTMTLKTLPKNTEKLILGDKLRSRLSTAVPNRFAQQDWGGFKKISSWWLQWKHWGWYYVIWSRAEVGTS